jgi:hypothetical protein
VLQLRRAAVLQLSRAAVLQLSRAAVLQPSAIARCRSVLSVFIGPKLQETRSAD